MGIVKKWGFEYWAAMWKSRIRS